MTGISGEKNMLQDLQNHDKSATILLPRTNWRKTNWTRINLQMSVQRI